MSTFLYPSNLRERRHKRPPRSESLRLDRAEVRVYVPAYAVADPGMPPAVRDVYAALDEAVAATDSAVDRVIQLEADAREYDRRVREAVEQGKKAPAPRNHDVEEARLDAAVKAATEAHQAERRAALAVERVVVANAEAVHAAVVKPLADADRRVREVYAELMKALAERTAILDAEREIISRTVEPPGARGKPAQQRSERLRAALAAARPLRSNGVVRNRQVRLEDAVSALEAAVTAVDVEQHSTWPFGSLTAAEQQGAAILEANQRLLQHRDAHLGGQA